ncbi:MAG: hypothetical protein ABSD49_08960 [Candidatus Bathyarchaeia archaeon]
MSFPNRYKIPYMEVTSSTVPVKWNVVETANNRAIEITAANSGEIACIVELMDAVQDSGWDLYPLVSGHVNLEMTLGPYDRLRLRLRFPKGCRGYIHHSQIKIQSNSYDFTSEAKDAGRNLDHDIYGIRDLQISYILIDDVKKSMQATIEVNSYFRQAFVSLSGSFLLPFLIGFPIILVWGFPGLDLLARMSFTLSAIPLVFSMWYRTLSSGSQDVLSLMDGIYAFLAIVWAGYALLFQALGTSIGLSPLALYFLLIFYAVYLLSRFWAHPFADQLEDQEFKSVPRVLRFYRHLVNDTAGVLNRIYYGNTR